MLMNFKSTVAQYRAKTMLIMKSCTNLIISNELTKNERVHSILFMFCLFRGRQNSATLFSEADISD
jgi:hypothetical protein